MYCYSLLLLNNVMFISRQALLVQPTIKKQIFHEVVVEIYMNI